MTVVANKTLVFLSRNSVIDLNFSSEVIFPCRTEILYGRFSLSHPSVFTRAFKALVLSVVSFIIGHTQKACPPFLIKTLIRSKISSFLPAETNLVTIVFLLGGEPVTVEIFKSAKKVIARLLGMGVADIPKICGQSSLNSALCSIPNRCCSSIIERPRFGNLTSF